MPIMPSRVQFGPGCPLSLSDEPIASYSLKAERSLGEPVLTAASKLEIVATLPYDVTSTTFRSQHKNWKKSGRKAEGNNIKFLNLSNLQWNYLTILVCSVQANRSFDLRHLLEQHSDIGKVIY